MEIIDLVQTLAQHPELLAIPGIIRRDSDTGERVDPYTGDPIDDDDDDGGGSTSNTGGLLQPRNEQDNEPEPEPDPEPSGSGSSSGGGGDTGLGFDEGPLTSEQLEAIRNQDFVSGDSGSGSTSGGNSGGSSTSGGNTGNQVATTNSTGGETGLGFDAGPLNQQQLDAIRQQNQQYFENNPQQSQDDPSLTADELREIANQDFVNDDTTRSINENLDRIGGITPEETQNRQEDSGSGQANTPAAPTVDDSTTVSTQEAQSTTTTTDFQSQLQDFIDNMKDVRSQLVEAQKPTQEEETLRERIRKRQQRFEKEQQQSRQRQAPQFAIRGELSERRQEFNRTQSALRDDLQALVDRRSTKVDQLTQRLQNNRQNFKMVKDLQKLSTPQVRSTRVNDQTGEVTAITRDPLSGELSTQRVGSVSVADQEAEIISKNELADGSLGIIKKLPDGSIEMEKVTDANGNIVQARDVTTQTSGGSSGGGSTQTAGLEGFTSSDQAAFQGLATGFGLDPTQFSLREKNTIVNTLSNSQARQFMRDFASSGSSDPGSYLLEWTENNTGEQEEDVASNQFENQFMGKGNASSSTSTASQTSTSSQSSEENDGGSWYDFLIPG
jgi:anti-sigma-K factor RskA